MQRSEQRILTTHTGSLPRPPDLVQMMLAQEAGVPVDRAALTGRVQSAVGEIVDRQLETGLAVIDDGEVSKPSYSTYVKDRLTGFNGESHAMVGNVDGEDFPEWGAAHAAVRGRRGIRMPACNGPISVADPEAVRHDIANLKAALNGKQPAEVFMTAVSPGQISRFQPNEYYPSHEAYLYALADAMKHEYRAIVDAGFLLQLDCPDLASGRNSTFAHAPLEDFLKAVELHIEALNYAVEGLPEDCIRMHLCWGNYAGPHHRDVPLKEILPLVFKAKPQAISFEAANPRHEHEWRLFEQVKLPEGKILIPGVIDSCSNYVEHPEVVAQRITRFANVVGRENVIAGTDCGFGTFVGSGDVDPQVAWAKLGSLVEGAQIASKELW
jgi:5-methyltetrahydropteroyltriglutamate--homocysteine methyltransferase